MASLDTKDDKLHRALNMITEAVGILQNSPRSSQDIMADCIYFPHRGGLRSMEKPGEGCKKGLVKSRGRGEKDCRNPGGGVIRHQNPGDGLRLKPFSRGIWQ